MQPQKRLEISVLGSREMVLSIKRISCTVTTQLICAFVFTYAKCRFSNDTAQIFDLNTLKQYTAIFTADKMAYCDIFLTSAQNIDCGYMLEPPH